MDADEPSFYERFDELRCLPNSKEIEADVFAAAQEKYKVELAQLRDWIDKPDNKAHSFGLDNPALRWVVREELAKHKRCRYQLCFSYRAKSSTWFGSSECEFSVIIYQDEHIARFAAKISEYAKCQMLETLSLEATLSSLDAHQDDFAALGSLFNWVQPILLERGLLLKRKQATNSSFRDNDGWIITLLHQ